MKELPEWAQLYAQNQAEKLFLSEWLITFQLSLEPAGSSENRGSCNSWSDIRQATITLRTDIEDSAEWRKTITHELLHVRFSGIQDFVELDLIGELSMSAKSIAGDVWRKRLEPVVELLARLLL